MYNYEWHFYDLNRKKTIVSMPATQAYNVGDGKWHNGKGYQVVGKVVGMSGKKAAILLAIEV